MMKRFLTLIYFVFAVGFSAAGILLSAEAENMTDNSVRALSVEERVAYQQKIEEVYWQRRFWNNSQPKPKLEEVLPLAIIQAKVEDGLRKSNALEKIFNLKITPEMLQAEINRISRETRQPEVLREIFAALDNNPYLIAECLARPILIERLTTAGEGDFAGRWENERDSFSAEIAPQDFNYALPEISAGGTFADDTWKGLPTLPDGYFEHTIVWTGAEMLVWGGTTTGSFTGKTNSGSRYNPATDSWLPITGSGAPQPRRAHSAVWTGTEMIVWGGCGPALQFCGLNDGGRYNPATDSWIPVQFNGNPGPRLDHTAVWTGDRMIVYGGCNPNANFTSCPARRDGGMYFPATDSWVLITNSVSARRNHTAVWTGTEMLAWGGFANVGERFNPNTNSWTPMSAANAPESRERHTAVWTGTEMIVWGGQSSNVTFNTGGRYNPSNDTWTPTSLINAPSARYLHTAVWTGSEMIVWGGNVATLGEGWLNDGGRYNPATDSWTPTNTTNAPTPRDRHEAIWTGTEMIVWGGRRDDSGRTGGRYNPATDSWLAVSTNGAPANTDAKTIWTGAEMIVWGGAFTNRGSKYNPATRVWSPIANPPAGLSQRDHSFTLVWTGTEMIVWGGQNGSNVRNTGGRYNPATDSWTLTSTINAPSPRASHTAVWSGTEMIVWGGTDGTLLNDGGRYNPSSNSWTPLPMANAPEARLEHTAVFVAGKMIVWGGLSTGASLNTGGHFDVSTNLWQPTSTQNAPSPRTKHTAVSTGTEMIVWGGSEFQFGTNFFNTGGRYNPNTDVWIPTSTTSAPAPRALHTAVWTGKEMIVWGGNTNDGELGSNTGGRYNHVTDTWRPTSTFFAGVERSGHNAVWTGRSMIIWGGNVRSGNPKAGYEYFAETGAPTPTPTPTLGGIEADVAARPNGDGSILSDDVVQIRKFLNGTDTPDQTTDEFQRADSSPFVDRGDGRIFSDDVVQARRYQNGTNAKQIAGGPMTASAGKTVVDQLFGELSKTVFENAINGLPRQLRIENATTSAGQMVTVNIRVDSAGDESEYGFIINYDSSMLSNPVIGAGSVGASVRSCNVSVAGQIKCSVGAFAGNNTNSADSGIGEIEAGTNQILMTVTFTVAANVVGETPLSLSEVNASSDAPQLFTPTATNGTIMRFPVRQRNRIR